MMERSSLELKLISCRDLKAFNLFQKLSVYAVVSIFSDELKEQEDRGSQRQKTPVDEQGGRHPEWNRVMQFDVSAPHGLFLKFKFRCQGVVFGKRTIGQVDVRVQDLIDEFNGSVRFVSYQIRTSDGKPNGVLNFSYEVKGKAEFPCKNRISVSAEEGKRSSSMDVNQQKRLYPCLDDIRTPLPLINLNSSELHYPKQESYGTPSAYVVGYGVFCPSPSSAGPHCYTAQTAAGYDYGCSGWAN